MRELDNQNPVEAGRSCYRKNPAVYGGSIKNGLKQPQMSAQLLPSQQPWYITPALLRV